MKKIILLAVLFVFNFSYSQKVLEIYNFSSFDIRLDMIVTKDGGSGSGGFPWCASVTPNPIATLGFGEEYTMENVANQFRFPYNSSVSSPVITNWRWVFPPNEDGNSDWTNITSNAAWVLGSNQVFDYLNFTVWDGSAYIESDYVGEEEGFWGSEHIESPNGWEAIYSVSQPDPNNLNYILYTIVFF